MAKNQTGVAIVIKAFLPTGTTIDEQFAALSIVKDAHATGDYAALLKAAQIDEVKTEQKTRRVEDEPAAAEPETTQTGENTAETTTAAETTQTAPADEPTTEEIPGFLKRGKKQASENVPA